MIEVLNVIKKYDSNIVLNINDLMINDHDFIALIGPNGAGKTTLLEIIGDLIEYEGEIISCIKDYEMTMVFQNPHLISKDVYYNLAYPLMIRKIDKKLIDKEVNDISEKFKIKNLLNKKYDALSAGERQKVALARALIFKPKLLLLDEPTANLDPEIIKEIESILKEVSKSMIIILVTHSLALAKRLANRVIFMSKGHIIEDDTNDNIFNHPKTAELKNFIECEALK